MIEIGFFKEHHGQNYAPFESGILPQSTKNAVLAYMKRGKVLASAPGIMKDAFDGSVIPGEMLVYTDGKYIWGTEAIHYLQNRDIKLPDSFIQQATR